MNRRTVLQSALSSAVGLGIEHLSSHWGSTAFATQSTSETKDQMSNVNESVVRYLQGLE